MLSIGRALLLNPRLLILDEPSQGLAPLIVREVFRIVQQMKAEGISVLLVEQNARMSLEIADDAYVLDDGIVVYSGTAARTRRRRGAGPGARRRQRRGMDADVESMDAAFRIACGHARPASLCLRAALAAWLVAGEPRFSVSMRARTRGRDLPRPTPPDRFAEGVEERIGNQGTDVHRRQAVSLRCPISLPPHCP